MGHPDSDDTKKVKLLQIAAVVGGSALGGSLMSGAPMMAVLQSFEGSVGVGIGYAAGILAEGVPALASYSYLPWIGAAAVPLIAGGVADKSLIGLLAGGVAGAMIAKSYA